MSAACLKHGEHLLVVVPKSSFSCQEPLVPVLQQWNRLIHALDSQRQPRAFCQEVVQQSQLVTAAGRHALSAAVPSAGTLRHQDASMCAEAWVQERLRSAGDTHAKAFQRAITACKPRCLQPGCDARSGGPTPEPEAICGSPLQEPAGLRSTCMKLPPIFLKVKATGGAGSPRHPCAWPRPSCISGISNPQQKQPCNSLS